MTTSNYDEQASAGGWLSRREPMRAGGRGQAANVDEGIVRMARVGCSGNRTVELGERKPHAPCNHNMSRRDRSEWQGVGGHGRAHRPDAGEGPGVAIAVYGGRISWGTRQKVHHARHCDRAVVHPDAHGHAWRDLRLLRRPQTSPRRELRAQLTCVAGVNRLSVISLSTTGAASYKAASGMCRFELHATNRPTNAQIDHQDPESGPNSGDDSERSRQAFLKTPADTSYWSPAVKL